MSEEKTKKTMNPEIKAKWLEKLRSGEIKQVKESLKTEEGMCCLGVLCQVYIEDKGLKWDLEGSVNNSEYFVEGINENGFLPVKVAEWAQIPVRKLYKGYEVNYNTVDIRDGRGRLLSNLNDEGKTFEQIANVIEKFL